MLWVELPIIAPLTTTFLNILRGWRGPIICQHQIAYLFGIMHTSVFLPQHDVTAAYVRTTTAAITTAAAIVWRTYLCITGLSCVRVRGMHLVLQLVAQTKVWLTGTRDLKPWKDINSKVAARVARRWFDQCIAEFLKSRTTSRRACSCAVRRRQAAAGSCH